MKMSIHRKGRLHFVRAEEPLPYAAADFAISLLPEGRAGAADFKKTLFILPTHRAARTFREVLLTKLAERGGALSLDTATPEQLLARVLTPEEGSNIFASHCAWKIALGNLDAESAEQIFASARLSREDAFELAIRIGALKKELSQNGLTFSKAAKLAARLPDEARWRAFAKLEALYEKSLALSGFRDAADTFLEALERPDFSGIGAERIILLFCPEVGSVLRRILSAFEDDGGRTEILVCAQSGQEALFDEFGAPFPGAEFPSDELPDGNIVPVQDGGLQADKISAKLMLAADKAGSVWAVSCDEQNSLKDIAAAVEKRGGRVCSFTGAEVSDFGIFWFFSAVSDFLDKGGDFDSLMIMARTDIFLHLASSELGISAEGAISSLDDFAAEHLPRTLRSALRIGDERNPVAGKLLPFAEDLLAPLCEGDACAGLEKFIGRIRASRETAERDALQAEAEKLFFDRISMLLEKFGELSFKHGIDAAHALKMILSEPMGRTPRPSEGGGGAVELQNWLEIFWSPTPRLILADFNEGLVPQSPEQNPFLSEGARECFGLATSALRRARDAYMLQSLIRSRANTAAGFAVFVFCPAKDFSGDRLMPSALLLSCGAERAALRIKRLFGGEEQKKASPAFFSPWKFAVPFVRPKEELSATDFKAYMECPFRFYLGRILKMQPINPPEEDMDTSSFGSLFHAVMEDFARCKRRDSLDEEEISALLCGFLNRRAEKIFGADIPAALKIQLSGLQGRLKACARAQALHAAEGWRIVSAENRFDNLRILGTKIICRIDRIDKAPDGTLLALDYKTADSSVLASAKNSAEYAHIRKGKGKDAAADWKDLQLPLYKRTIENFYGEKRVKTAYFLATKSVLKTRVDIWDIDDELEASALKKAEEIVSEIKAGNFRPSEKTPSRYDNYDKLFGFAGAELGEYLEFKRS